MRSKRPFFWLGAGLFLVWFTLPTALLGCITDGFVGQDGNTNDGGNKNDGTNNPDGTTNPDGTDPDGTTNPDGTNPDGGEQTVTPEKTNTEQGQPESIIPEPLGPEPFRLLSAFSGGSSGGSAVTLRFNNKVDPTTGAVIANFRTTPILPITAAKVDGFFIQLTLDASKPIDPNRLYTVRVDNVKDTNNQELEADARTSEIKSRLYVNLIWHQHQPMYVDPLKDEMQGPWVRKHATKSYYDMAGVLEKYPDVHLTINLTAVMLIQLQLYIDRLGPYYDKAANRIKATEFLKDWRGKTDPWVDLLLSPTPEPATMSTKIRGHFYDDPWATVSTSPQVMRFWPEYEALRDKNRQQYTKEDLLKLKFFFEIAWMDPDFTKGPVKLPDGDTVDLSDIVEQRADGRKYIKVPITEDLCNRMVAESYKIMKNVVGIHKKLQYNPLTKKGQIEVITTPFYHPILPLIHDTDLAKKTPFVDDIKLPPQPFQYPQDAFAQVAKARYYYRTLFGIDPQGMWPGEGSVAEETNIHYIQNNVRWIATGEDNLRRSKPENQALFYPYRVDSDTQVGTSKDELMIVFRDNKISDLIGFGIQGLAGETAATRLIEAIAANAPPFGAKDRLLTIILDGENAWENFTIDYDAKDFFNAFYGKLQDSFKRGDIIGVTPSEYIDGNPDRGIPAHPVKDLQELEPLNAGSWIDGTFRVWIGEDEETCGWNHLLRARQDLDRAGIPRPNPASPTPPESSPAYNAYMAWESIYAAEGSDWFWWFGDDMTTPANDDSGFDNVFRALLTAAYRFANKAGATLTIPSFRPCVQPKPKPVPDSPCTACPTIDGQFTRGTAEWTDDGGFIKDPDSAGEIPDPNDDIDSVFIAFDLNKLYLGILSSEILSDKLGKNYKLIIYFSHRNILNRTTGQVKDDPKNDKTPAGTVLPMRTGGAARRLILDFSGTQVKATMQTANGSGGWSDVATNGVVLGGPTTGQKLIEMSVPWTDLNLSVKAGEYDPLEVMVIAEEGGKEIDVAPNFGTFTVFEDASDAVFVTFEVDVSGTEEPLDKYKTCCKEQPKNKGGTADAYIVGNHRKLGMVGVDAQGKPVWVPNKIRLTPDPSNPNIYTFTLGLPKGYKLNYKYTIGTNSDEGRWTGTEEFPVTFRGFLVDDPSGKRCIKIRDIFANKPVGGRDGEVGSKSNFQTGCTR